jgi:hypothetical protein
VPGWVAARMPAEQTIRYQLSPYRDAARRWIVET